MTKSTPPLIALALSLAVAVPDPAPAQQWDYSTSKDEMTVELQAYAHSPRTTATEPMNAPYRGVEAWLGFGCDGQDEWAYIGFSESPNLVNTETQDGYDAIKTRIRWNDEILRVRLTQEWGDRFLHFTVEDRAIERMVGARTALLELNWYGSGEVYFRFTLNGSANAIEQVRRRCQQQATLDRLWSVSRGAG